MEIQSSTDMSTRRIIHGRRGGATFGLLLCALVSMYVENNLGLAQSQNNQQQKSQSGQSGKISGHVFRSDTGAPVNKTDVTLLGAQQAANGSQVEKTELVRTAQDGSYSFTDIGPGNYTLRFEKTGYVGQYYGQNGPIPSGASIRLGAAQTLENMDVHLTPAGVISGTIYDEDNEPLEGIQVTAIQMRYSRGGREQEAQVGGARTDDLGNYRLSGLAPGPYYIKTGGTPGSSVFSAGMRGGLSYGARYYPGTPSLDTAQRVQVTSGAEARGIQMSLTIEKLYKIVGAIFDATENAGQRRYSVRATRVITSDVLTAASLGGQIISTPMTSMTIVGGTAAGSHNTFTLEGIQSGDYVITATANDPNPQAGQGRGNPPARVDVGYATVRVSDGNASVNIPIGHASEVRGQAQLENPPGPQITSFRVALQGQSLGGGRGGSGTQALDAAGAFDFKDMPPGQYSFSLSGGQSGSYMKRVICGGRDFTWQPLSLEVNQTLNDCSITIANDAGTVSGQVRVGNKPVPGLAVVMIPQSRELRRVPRFTMTATSDSSGQYVISGVIPGDYYMFAVLPTMEQAYFALDYPDRNQSSAELASVKANESKVVNPKPSAPQ